MLDLFAAAPPNVRRARLEEYHRYLVERDGEMNLEERTLSRREASMKKYETPPKALRDMDADEFNAWWARDAARLAEVVKQIGKVE